MANEMIRILLIEDEDPHAELIERAFDGYSSEFELHRTRSLTEARSYIRSDNPNLIIADWRLPDGESLELLSDTLDPLDPLSTPVILMTSYGNEKIAVEALKSGAVDYVVKSPESMMDMPHFAERAIDQWKSRAERIHFQAQFRLLAENASDMISRNAPDGTFLYASPACLNILGYSPEELIGKNSLEFIHPQDKDLIQQFLEKKVPTTKTYTIVYRALKKNGAYIWLETSARMILNNSKLLLEIQSASRDITERKKAEEALTNAHKELGEAYERTIEGWVRALDLRDRETEGHTQRVTELTEKIAPHLGFNASELIHIRRGALLHDMGKIAIKDDILQKPASLTEIEWVEMRRHPIYAYEMLHPITYLRPALDIPYCHHEHWDGGGYPRGLKGEEIPLSARLFTIIDVWDALTSDRPYRKKMPIPEVQTYIKNESGKLFDPKLVELVLDMIQGINKNL